MKRLKEYQFKIGNVCFDIHAYSEKEAVQMANDHLYMLEDAVCSPPGNFMRIQLDIKGPVTNAHIVDTIPL